MAHSTWFTVHSQGTIPGGVECDQQPCPGLVGEPVTPAQVQKKKVWEACAPLMRTDANRVACADGGCTRGRACMQWHHAACSLRAVLLI